MTRTARNIVVAVLVCLVAAALAAPAGAARGDVRAGRSHAGRRGSGGGGGGLSFTKPVALESFAPPRTAASTVYSARNGEMPPDHEWSGEPVIQVDDRRHLHRGDLLRRRVLAGVAFDRHSNSVGPFESADRAADETRI